MWDKLNQVFEDQRSRFFLWWPVLFGAGSGIYFALPTEPLMPLGLSATCLVTTCAIGYFLFPNVLRLLLFALCFVAGGLVWANFRTISVAAPVLVEPFMGTVEGRVIKIDRSRTNRLRITLDRVTLYGLAPAQTPQRVRLTLPSKGATATVSERILIYGRLEAPGPPVEPGGFDFRKWAWFEQLGGVGYALGPIVRSDEISHSGFWSTVGGLRQQLSNHIQSKIPGKEGGFAAAILTGDRSGIDPRQLDDLRASNLAHLLAISGLHMGLLTGFVFGLVRYGIAAVPGLAMRINAKKVGAAVAIPAGAAYLILSGASIATQRAFIMALVILVAVLIDRPAFTLRAVALAALIVLLIAPEAVTEVGFQLSFAATVGLVAAFELLRQIPLWRRPVTGWRKVAKGVFSVAFSSAVAGAATAPFGAFHFNQFPQYGLLANIFAVPIMGLIVMPSSLIALLIAPFGPDGAFFWTAGMGISAILWIAQKVAALEGAVVYVSSTHAFVLPLLAGGALFWILWLGRARWAGPVVIVFGMSIWLLSDRPDVLVGPNGNLVGVMTDDGRALRKVKGGGFIARSWLEHDGDPNGQSAATAREWDVNTIAHLGDTKGNLADVCRGSRLVVAPDLAEIRSTTTGGCLVIDRTKLNKHGAIAVYFDDDRIRIKGSLSKERVWSTQ